jgi:hypothetical protein
LHLQQPGMLFPSPGQDMRKTFKLHNEKTIVPKTKKIKKCKPKFPGYFSIIEPEFLLCFITQ